MSRLRNSKDLSDGKQYFLVEMEFQSGDYGQIFHKIFIAKNNTEAWDMAAKWLEDYYGEDNYDGFEDNRASYFGGEVAVKILSSTEILQLQDLIKFL